MNRYLRAGLLLTLSLAITACAVRLGGGGPRQYDAVALLAGPGADAAETAGRLRAADAELVLLSADRDDAWFASVAEAAGLELSGPGRSSGRGFAFLSSLEMVGDTSLVLEVAGGGSVHMHDALYRVDGDRYVDLMLVRFDAPDVREAVRTLFGYIATDVMANAAVLLAIDAPTSAEAQDASVLMRAHYTPAFECAGVPEDASVGGIRLLYGPTARVSCNSVRVLPGTPPGIHADIVVQR
ncbi:MAG TPA: hypothetical protein VK929_01645 [Longimicrobiales bacterium]|nr:hypothetical protein [Longimicrobiales bacterium]